MGQTDIHRLSEAVICPILKTVLHLPALRNLNTAEHENYPGIDLGDSTLGVGIQVTARADAPKIRRTIRTCIKHRIYDTYPRLLFFVLTAKQASYRLDVKEALDGRMTFDPQSDVLDYTDVLKSLAKLDRVDLLGVAEALEEDIGIRAALSPPNSVTSASESAWLNLLPLRFPSRLYLGEIIPAAQPKKGGPYRNPRYWAKKHLAQQRANFSADWTAYEGQIVTFHDLRRPHLPLARLVDPGTVMELATDEYHGIDDNYRRAFKTLLRFCLQQLLHKRGVFWQHKARLFCFGPRRQGDDSRVESWSASRGPTREVFKRVPKRDAPDETYHCKHLAFQASFHVFDSAWYLSIKPDWFFSSDGYRPWPWSAEKIEFLKRLEKNQAAFNHVKFLARFLRQQPDLFGRVPADPFLTFEPLASLRGLPVLQDDAWRVGEPEKDRAKLQDPDGVLPLDSEST